MMNNKLRKHVLEMRRMADMLVPYTYPKVDYEDEQDVIAFKQRQIIVDGYEIMVVLSRSDNKSHHLVSLQIQSATSPFLPFNLVCKLARTFLGPKHLSYVEFLREGRKLYCWTLRITSDGRYLPPSTETEPISYEGFQYNILNPSADDVS